MDHFTEAQLKAIAIVPKISALISLTFALYTVAEIIQNRTKLSNVYHRIMLTIALNAIPLSIAFLLGTWVAPKGTSNTAWAFGTTATCTAQGLVIQTISQAIIFYYSSLSLYSIIAVQNNFNQKVLRKFEPWLHAVGILYSLSASVYGVKNEMFNPAGPWCWVEIYPMDCVANNAVECTRGIPDADFKSVNTFKFFSAGISLIITFGFSIIMMLVLYVMVRNTEKDTKEAAGKKKYLSQAKHKKSRIVAKQAAIYICVGYSTLIGVVILRCIQLRSDKMWFPVAILSWSINPLQSFFLLLMYRLLSEKTIGQASQDNDPMSVAAICRRAQNKECGEPLKTNRSAETNHEAFSIFDGRSPSLVWAEFIVPDDIDGFSDDEQHDQDQSADDDRGDKSQLAI